MPEFAIQGDFIRILLNSHTLQKGNKFKDLPNLYIIFILEHDMFEKGEAVYRIRKTLDIKDEQGVEMASKIETVEKIISEKAQNKA